jgi:phytoene synthase
MNFHASTSTPEPRARAVGSSFYLAMRIMPPDQRQAIFEIYSFCREVDDIADGGGEREVQIAELNQWRADIDAIYADAPPVNLAGLAEAIRDFDMRREDFVAVIDGMEMDVIAPGVAMDWATLDLYCDRVASAVGRLAVRIFGMDEQPGRELAHHLGRALQLTNILRDIDEDAEFGRLYLPLEALRDAGITATEPSAVVADPAIGLSCAPVVARALRHFRESDAIFARTPRRLTRTPRMMAAAYRMILDSLIARGWQAPRASVKPRRSALLWVLLRSALP